MHIPWIAKNPSRVFGKAAVVCKAAKENIRFRRLDLADTVRSLIK